MKLHIEKDIFQEFIKLSAVKFNLNLIFIEKDYWITLVLYRLARSKYVN
jgi:hypothetical protein